VHFEIKGIDLELSDRNQWYYMVDIIVYEDTEEGIHEDFMKVVYDSRQKLIFGFHRADIQEKSLLFNTLTYRSNNNMIIRLCNCTNNYRYSDEFNKHYKMHKANMDFHLFNMIKEIQGIE